MSFFDLSECESSEAASLLNIKCPDDSSNEESDEFLNENFGSDYMKLKEEKQPFR